MREWESPRGNREEEVSEEEEEEEEVRRVSKELRRLTQSSRGVTRALLGNLSAWLDRNPSSLFTTTRALSHGQPEGSRRCWEHESFVSEFICDI